MEFHFLHGFLGLPSDWETFSSHFKKWDCHFHSIEKHIKNEENDGSQCFELWSQSFNRSIFLNHGSNKNKKILIGYSLGGRLALQSLIAPDAQWDAAIIISANPGLLKEQEKIERILSDGIWAKWFLNEPWEGVLEKWNSQGVFSHFKNNLTRHEKDFNKRVVAQMLSDFSLGKQENLREKIRELHIPILWLAGERDKKFVNIATEVEGLNKQIQTKIIPEAGHRVPWENPSFFIESVLGFIMKISL
jgi:2-succinyl-6-hydroxy-2,4-cyclohexadiene-1-carboxylate synthase